MISFYLSFPPASEHSVALNYVDIPLIDET